MTKHHPRGRAPGGRGGRKPLALAAIALALVLGLAVAAGALGGAGQPTAGADQLVRGQQIYAFNCASCHGANLEGQANAQALMDQGLRPAPPHDETGHTWHHPDAYLLEVTRQGIAPGMPGYASLLDDDEIRAVLAYIKSTWPPEIRAQQPQ